MLRLLLAASLILLLLDTPAQTPQLVLPVGHTLGVYCTNFSPDGKKIVTGGRDNNALVWDAASGKLLRVLRGHSQLISSVQFSPDGKKVLTASLDNLAAVWDISTGKYIGVLQPKRSPYSADVLYEASYNADGSLIVTRGSTDGIMIWDALTYKLLFKAPQESPYDQQAVFSPDGKQLLVSDGPNILVLDARTGQLVRKLYEGQSPITALSISAEQSLLLAHSREEGATVWNLADGSKKSILAETQNVSSAFLSPGGQYALFLSASPQSINADSYSLWDVQANKKLYDGAEKTNYLRCNQFSADGKYFVTSPNSSTTKIWETKSGKLINQFVGDSVYGLVDCARFSPNGNQLLTGGFDRAAHLWDVSAGYKISKLSGHTLYTNTLRYSKDGKYYVTASDDGSARIIEAATGAAVVALKGHKGEIMYSEFSPDGQKLLTVSRDATARIWDSRGNLMQVLKGHKALIFRGEFSPDGSRVITASNDSTAKVWDAGSGKLLLDLRGHKSQVWNAHFSNDGKKLVTASIDGTAMLWDAATSNLLFVLDYGHGLVADAVFSPDNSKVLLTGEFNEPVLYDATNGKGVLVLDGHKAHVYTAAFSHDGKMIYTGARDGTAGLWSTITNGFVRELKGHSNQITAAQFTSDDKMLITTSQDRKTIVWAVETGAIVNTFTGHTDFIRTVALSPDEKTVLTVSEDNSIKQWSLEKKALEFTRVELDATDYLVYTPGGYYSSSPDAAKKLHYVTSDLQVITFDQLDLRYNRPDLVLSSFDKPDMALIQSYQKAWQKRAGKLGVDTAQFSAGFKVPQASIINRDAFAFEQTQPVITLQLQASDSSSTLQRYNVWVNDVPLFGAKGKAIANLQKFQTTEKVTLSNGINRIEFSVVNANGTESFRLPLLLQYKPATKTLEKVYFVGIGLNQYANGQYNLTWSVKDIRDMALALKKHYGDNITIDTLFDAAVNREAVLRLKQKLQALNENDKVIVSYSGHGVLSKDLDYFLSTYHINFEDPAVNGLPYDELESLMDGIRPRQKLMLIDACHSGEVDKEEFGRIEAVKGALQANGVSARSSIKVVKQKNLGMTNSFELMQQLFANVRRGTGATIISAAGAMQYAQERGDLKNGVFTYCILDAFNSHSTLSVSQLKKIVTEKVPALTNGLQKPTSRNETINVDWKVW
jgi:WD40 repeat protein